MIATLNDLLLVLVQRLAITYPDGEVSRGLDAVATASDLLVVLVLLLALTQMMSRLSLIHI